MHNCACLSVSGGAHGARYRSQALGLCPKASDAQTFSTLSDRLEPMSTGQMKATYWEESETAQFKLMGNGDSKNIENQAECHGNDSGQTQVVSRMILHGLQETRIFGTGR